MVRPHCAQVIIPFPEHIGRDHFGSWLSGFTDGEGCFHLGWDNKKGPRACFSIQLRFDDTPILKLIQSFFSCGRLYRKMKRRPNERPGVEYVVYPSDQLVKIVVPHYETYPLLAKKAKDFPIWKEGVLLLHEVYLRPKTSRVAPGSLPKWRPGEKDRFLDLRETLRKGRFPAREAADL